MTRKKTIDYHKKQGDAVRERILQYIREYVALHGYAPAYNEIATSLGIKSNATVFVHMKVLLNEGKLETDLEDPWHTSRAYRLAK